MRIRKIILTISCVMVAAGAFAQSVWKADTLHIAQPLHTFAATPTFTNALGKPIPQDYYTRSFGFFCRQELKMQQAHVPVAFRLGSMDYCNWLEQKSGNTATH